MAEDAIWPTLPDGSRKAIEDMTPAERRRVKLAGSSSVVTTFTQPDPHAISDVTKPFDPARPRDSRMRRRSFRA